MDIPVVYEDEDMMAISKPAGLVVFEEDMHAATAEKEARLTLIGQLIKQFPALQSVGEAPRYGIAHRLDKDTSGLLLVAKSPKGLIFLSKQFKNRDIQKKYLALVTGVIEPDTGTITNRIGRSPKDPAKQKAYRDDELTPQSAREAITHYTVLERFTDYTLLEVQIETGRKHQIRCHLAFIHHPVAGDTLYSFKDSPRPEGLARHFLHASYIKIQLPARNASHSDAGGENGQVLELHADLPEELNQVIQNLKSNDNAN